MEYDHSTKAGNQGDLIKHFALVQSVVRMAPSANAPFHYVETHAGRHHYIVDDSSSSWQRGAGAFIQCYRAQPNSSPELDALYTRLSSGDDYPGSSLVVFEQLQQMGVEPRFTLFDTDPEVMEALNRDYPQVEVELHCRDGYQGARAQQKIDLLFIDPPNIHSGAGGQFDDYRALLEQAIAQQIPFVSWNSLHGTPGGEGPSATCCAIQRLAEQHKVVMFTVRWSAWREEMCGCQMLLSHPEAQKSMVAVEPLARLMGWAFECITGQGQN